MNVSQIHIFSNRQLVIFISILLHWMKYNRIQIFVIDSCQKETIWVEGLSLLSSVHVIITILCAQYLQNIVNEIIN